MANACATGATALRTAIMAVKAGESDLGLAVGVEKLAGRGPARRAAPQADDDWTPRAATARSPPVDGRIGTETMPGVFAQVGMEYGHKYGGTSFELFATHLREEPRPLDAESAGRLHEEDEPRRDHERRHDRLPEHPADVLGELRRRRRRRGGVRREAEDAVARAAARAVKVSASVLTTDPWQEACQVLPDVNTLTRNAAKQAYETAGVGPDDLDLVELHDCFATAELVHYDNLMLCEPGAARSTSSSPAPPGATARRR